MTVKLWLNNGKTKKYTTWCSRDVFVEHGAYCETKCGRLKKFPGQKDKECTHLDCAVYAAKENAKMYKQNDENLVLFGMVCVLMGIFSGMFLIIVGIISIPIGAWGLIHCDYNKELDELIEFDNRGTVNGMNAEMI